MKQKLQREGGKGWGGGWDSFPVCGLCMCCAVIVQSKVWHQPDLGLNSVQKSNICFFDNYIITLQYSHL